MRTLLGMQRYKKKTEYGNQHGDFNTEKPAKSTFLQIICSRACVCEKVFVILQAFCSTGFYSIRLIPYITVSHALPTTVVEKRHRVSIDTAYLVAILITRVPILTLLDQPTAVAEDIRTFVGIMYTERICAL